MTTACVQDLWAKDTGETLLAHTLNVVRIAQAVCANLPIAPQERVALTKLLIQLATFHDLGKCASGFQEALRSKQSWGHRHEIVSTALAAQLNPRLEAAGLFAIITHHRNLPPDHLTEHEKCLPADELPFGDAPTWRIMIAEARANAEALQVLLDDLAKKLQLVFPRLSVDVIDGLGLPEAWLRRGFQPRRVEALQRRRASLLRGLLITSDHLASAGMESVPSVPRFADCQRAMRRFELSDTVARPFQEKCGVLDGDAVLRAPTGSGKTLAAAFWAARNQAENGRFFYVLPHTASINAMHARLQRWLPRNSVGLLHHRAAAALFAMQENDDPRERAMQARESARLAHEIYHPVRVCTPHQIVRVTLRGRGWEMGLAELPNACFVFDEVHAFEPLLVGLTLAATRWLKQQGAKLLFVSATLPSFLERLLIETLSIARDHVMAPDATKPGDREVCEKVRHCVEVRSGNLLENLQHVVAEIRELQETALIVCNHVATAQAVWQTLRNNYRIGAALLHSRFNARDRTRMEQEITSPTPPHVLVATQAVEVSLDLDYQRGYSEPAPADALGQRFGRINRKGARAPAPVVIFEKPSAGHLYAEDTTQRTIELLAKSDLLTEQRLTEIVDEVYAGGYLGQAQDDYLRGLNHPTVTQFEETIVAGTHRPWVEDLIEQTDGQIEVLPLSLMAEYRALVDERRYLEAGLLLVPIRSRQFSTAVSRGKIRRDTTLDEWTTRLPYSVDSGLDLRDLRSSA